MLTIEDLGVLRDVAVDGDRVTVTITPTYSGCPAMDAIRDDVVLALTAAGFDDVEVRLTLAPAWTTDWMSEAGKRKLASTASRRRPGARPSAPIALQLGVRCPRCGSLDTRELSRFGSTSCKALYECRAASSPSTTSRCTDGAHAQRPSGSADDATQVADALLASAVGGPPRRAAACALPHAAGGRGAAAHRRCGRGDVRRPRATSRASSTTSPGSTWRCAPSSTDSEVRRSYSLCRPATARHRGVASASRSSATSAGAFSTWAQSELAAGRRARRDEPAGHLHLDARRHSTARTSPASPRGRASRR